MRYETIVIGVSMGGLNALKIILSGLPASFPMAIIIVQHISPQSDSIWINLLDRICKLPVSEAVEKERVLPSNVYIAPPGYHLLVEKDKTFSISADHRVNFARPSIDVLFESAAETYREKLVGVVLTGANHDGAAGLAFIQQLGGYVVVQDPHTAEAQVMPKSAIEATQTKNVFSLEKIVDLLIQLSV